MAKKEKQMSIDDLKVFLEERNDIKFNYDAIEEKKTNDFVYYLVSQKVMNNMSVEIYNNKMSSGGTFNLYLVSENDHDILKAWIGCTPESVEDHLRKEFGVMPRKRQGKLF